jgi:hypothetical protein
VADLLAIKCQHDADDFSPSLAYHVEGTTDSSSGGHDVVEDEHAGSGDGNTDHAPTFAVVFDFLAIVCKPNVNLMLRM